MSPERLEKITANEGLTPEQILRKDIDIYFSDRFIRENPEKIKESVEGSLRSYQPPDAFQRQFAACLEHDNVNRITVPTLIASGHDDPLVPPENSRLLKDLIPHAELIFLPGKRHCFFIEEAEKFNPKAIDLFKSV